MLAAARGSKAAATGGNTKGSKAAATKGNRAGDTKGSKAAATKGNTKGDKAAATKGSKAGDKAAATKGSKAAKKVVGLRADIRAAGKKGGNPHPKHGPGWPAPRMVAGTERARAWASAGGKATSRQKQLARLLGLSELREGQLSAYRKYARAWLDEQLSHLTSILAHPAGPGVVSIVCSAALQMAASRWFFDEGMKTGDERMMLSGSRLAEASKQSLLAAETLATQEAQDRAVCTAAPAKDWEALQSALEGDSGE